MMENKLDWNEISSKFNQEWVELVDYDWPDGEVNPLAGVVGVHAFERREFYQLLKENGSNAEDRAFVFVGQPKRPEGIIFSSFRIVPCE